ncbi:hypothetical protein [Roseovarius sp.]|uniref:hypothetical protein n=1 Tax=Roseovarius sp. TaxID=1486281 RepID=UPI003B5B4A01
MQNEWILDVLADLRTFARQNGLAELAEQIDDTRLVAAAELVSKSTPAREGTTGYERATATAARTDLGRPRTRP